MKRPSGFVKFGLIIMGLFAFPYISTGFIQLQTENSIYENVNDVPAAETGVVFGAAAYGERLSDVLRDRVDTGIELLEGGKIENIIMTGAPNETWAMKKYAIEDGVNEELITEDPKGLNTFQSIINLDSESNYVLITQRYHLPRALFIAKYKGKGAVGLSADKHEYYKINQFKEREILANTKAIIDIFWK